MKNCGNILSMKTINKEIGGDKVSFEECINLLKGHLDSIIDSHAEIFKESGSFKVRTGVADNKFYLDRVDGTYEESLHSLIHNLLWEKKYYHDLLPESQLEVVESIISDETDNIYSPDLDDESMELDEAEELQDSLSSLYFKVITHVCERLQDFESFDSSSFEDAGYILDDDDDYSDCDLF